MRADRGAGVSDVAVPGAAPDEEVPAFPAATFVLRRPGPRSVVMTLSGPVGRADAAVLSRCVHRELDRGPELLVLELGHDAPGPECLCQVVRVARERARAIGTGFRIVTQPRGADHAREVLGPS
jgi:hypothetical protein